MGRRIFKSKRHKKLKFVDPSYKGGTRPSKYQFNNPPPKDDDFQEMPSGMEEIIDFKNKMKENKLKKRKKKKKYKDDFIIVKNNIVEKIEPGMERQVKKIPSIMKQKKNETEGQFINRLQKMADMAKAEAKIEEKYNIEVVNIDKDGTALYRSDSKPVNERKKEKRKRYNEKLKEKKRMKIDDKEFELKKDEVKFGEVVSAPPVLTAKPRKASNIVKKTSSNEKFQYQPENEKKKKLKEMPLDKRKEIEDERARAVQMYRILKNKKT